jgi:hypothetical protein
MLGLRKLSDVVAGILKAGAARERGVRTDSVSRLYAYRRPRTVCSVVFLEDGLILQAEFIETLPIRQGHQEGEINDAKSTGETARGGD